MEKKDNQPLEPQVWPPTPMLNGEPLRDDASLRDFNGGIGCYVALALEGALSSSLRGFNGGIGCYDALALEGALLLPNDMAELRNIRKNEVFLNIKIYLGMV